MQKMEIGFYNGILAKGMQFYFCSSAQRNFVITLIKENPRSSEQYIKKTEHAVTDKLSAILHVYHLWLLSVLTSYDLFKCFFPHENRCSAYF